MTEEQDNIVSDEVIRFFEQPERVYLGSGGYGSVAELDEKRVIKVYTTKTFDTATPASVQQIISARIPSAPCITEHGTYDEYGFLVMERLGGIDLYKLTANIAQLQAELRYRIAVGIIQQLRYLSDEKIFHGDFKPSNIWMRTNGQLSLFDFDNANFFPQNKDTISTDGHRIAPGYLAPELLSGFGYPSTDTYCAGVSLFELETGSPFYTACGLSNGIQTGKFYSQRSDILEQRVQEIIRKHCTDVRMQTLLLDMLLINHRNRPPPVVLADHISAHAGDIEDVAIALATVSHDFERAQKMQGRLHS